MDAAPAPVAEAARARPQRRAVPDEPPAELRFRRRVRPVAAVRELWRARELLRTLAERELRARYKQTVFGFAWAIVTPITLMVVFTLVFDRVADIDTGGVPYPLFVYLGLLPWTFFNGSVSQGGQSLISNMALLGKVYCPREVFPMGSMVVASIDTLTAMLAIGILFAIHQFAPQPEAIFIPVLLCVQVAFTLAVTLVVSAVMVYVRDVRHALPILLQLGLFATPVAYGIDIVPQWARPLYSALNPLAPVIDGYRRTVLLGLEPRWGLVAVGALSAGAFLVAGYMLFKKLETGFADVA